MSNIRPGETANQTAVRLADCCVHPLSESQVTDTADAGSSRSVRSLRTANANLKFPHGGDAAPSGKSQKITVQKRNPG